MAYRLKLDELAQKGLRRIASEQIRRAESSLMSGANGAGVHETRKCLKRIRALLRLMRPGMTPECFAEENARYRDIGRVLSGTRDKQILRETVLKLQTEQPEPHPALITLLGIVIEDNEKSPAISVDVTLALHSLETAAKAARLLKLKPAEFTTVTAGLEACYRKARKSFASAYADPTDEAIHEWRKTIQQHWRHMQLLSRAWPAYIDVRIEAARTLSQMLGDDHDLSILATFVKSLPENRLSAQAATDVVTLARARQAELRAAAAPRGRQLLAQSPGGLAKSIEEIWQAGRRMSDEPASNGPPADEPIVITLRSQKLRA